MDAYGKAKGAVCKVKVWVWATCCSGACWSHQCSNPRNRVRWTRHPFSAQNWRGAPKPSNQDTTLMQYFLKIKTNVKKKKKTPTMNKLSQLYIKTRCNPLLAQLNLISLTPVPILWNLVFCSSWIFALIKNNTALRQHLFWLPSFSVPA